MFITKGRKNMGILAIVAMVVVGALAFSVIWNIAEFVIAVLVWALIGYMAGRITRGEGFGWIGNVIVGLVGGMVGSFLFWLLGVGGLGRLPLIGGIVSGVVGAVVIVAIVNALNGSKRKRELA
jgi:uncharacterized membrane protein YeaQ/YmgE (transglycosylase-associated protein family)